MTTLPIADDVDKKFNHLKFSMLKLFVIFNANTNSIIFRNIYKLKDATSVRGKL